MSNTYEAGEFHLTIRTDNDAFSGDPGHEIAGLLRKIADRIEDGGAPSHPAPIMDYNGAHVGDYAIEQD